MVISKWICDEGLVMYCGMFFSMTVARTDLLSGGWDQVLNLSLDPVVKSTIAADVSVVWHQKGKDIRGEGDRNVFISAGVCLKYPLNPTHILKPMYLQCSLWTIPLRQLGPSSGMAAFGKPFKLFLFLLGASKITHCTFKGTLNVFNLCYIGWYGSSIGSILTSCKSWKRTQLLL